MTRAHDPHGDLVSGGSGVGVLAPTRPPETPLARLRWAVVDGWTVTRRDLTHWIRSPEEVLGGLTFPVVSVLLFGYVLGSAMVVPGGGDYREFLMPGLFGMTMVFGMVITASAVVTDTSRGVTDRFRSMPMAPSAVVAGRSVADMIRAALDLTALLGCGLLVGWRAHGGVAAFLAAVGLLLLLRFALIWVGIYVGLLLRTPESATTLMTLVLPFAMIANTFVAPELMPSWLGVVAEVNPMSATVAATRELFGNPGLGGGSWLARNALLMAVVWPVALVAVFFPLSVRRFRDMSR
ncbi:ABC transporter permease [Streptoalloteichus hindustanus]|uniref:Transport permease protein n=1 Tax=Streptoalloteichus hindustanus TaxID=2017 RepID=A0A1M5HZZ3_STRHI|nr:ABC transporter permease [Streptoalloteichus hindustanus]SHG21462.1 ABC transporter efflux protein, DrrB family [Streptoalloteichus hindustanus]